MGEMGFIAEPGKLEITVTRIFDASPERAFRTFTNPSLIPQWCGPSYLTTTVESMDVRSGGGWRFVQRDPQGKIHAFHGVYHAILPPQRLVYTFEYEGEPGHVLLETVTFEALPDGKTKMVDQSIFQSVQDRDGMLGAEMEAGMAETMQRFAALLAKTENIEE